MAVSGVVDATQDVVISWLRDGRRFVQALLVDVEGSAPLPVGAMLVVDEDGAVEGSITGGCVESAVVQESEAILAGQRGAGILTYGISDELAGTVGLMCGGTVHIFVRRAERRGARVPSWSRFRLGRRATRLRLQLRSTATPPAQGWRSSTIRSWGRWVPAAA